MNPYPSWIRRIPAMIEALALTATDPIDRRMAEQLFELRKTAAVQLLRRFGALYRGGSLVISRALLMARLREAHENPDWRWESERRASVRDRIESLRPEPARVRKSQVPVDAVLQQQLESLGATGLPATIEIGPGLVTIQCAGAEDLLRQLVLLVHTADTAFDALDAGLTNQPRRAPGRASAPGDGKQAATA